MRRLLLFIVLVCILGAHAQVGVNIPIVTKNVVLHVESPEKDKGFIIPRINTAARDAIVPLASEDGLTIYNTDEDCLNYWSGAEQAWKSSCGDIGKAEFTISDCSSLKQFGLYKTNAGLGGNHFITLEVEVTKVGTYHIAAQSAVDNGYFFSASGEFLSTGKFTMKILAMGKPKVTQVDLFKVALNGIVHNGINNGQDVPACSFEIDVEDSSKKPNYSMVCNSIVAKGVYKMDKPLTADNYLELYINVGQDAGGATYSIETDEVDGIKFKGQGVLVAGTRQRVVLQGEGTPFTTAFKRFTLKTNSTSTAAICYGYVRVVIPKKRLLTIGISENHYGYNFGGSAASNKLITEKRNYGALAESKVAFEGWDEIISITSPTEGELRANVTGSNPVDVVILGYSWVMNDQHADLLMEYLRKGGVVLAFTESNTGSARLLRQVFGNTSVNVKNGAGAGALYLLSAVDDPILNGPFGDIRNSYWGEDASHTSVALAIDRNSVYVYSDSHDQKANKAYHGGVTAFRHKEYNLVWVGDGGFNSNHSVMSNTICPFKLDSNNAPISKAGYGHGGSTGRLSVYNAIFTANAVGWAIEQAEKNGINSNNK